MSRVVRFATGSVLFAVIGGCLASPSPTSPAASLPPATLAPSPAASQSASIAPILVASGVAVATWSPDGQHLLVQMVAGGMPSVYDLAGAKVADLPGIRALWSGPRSLLVWTDRGVIVESLDQQSSSGPSEVSGGALVASTGAIAYDNGDIEAPSFRVWARGRTTSPRPGVPAAWSPDGSRLVVWLPAGPTPVAGPENLGHLELLAWPGLTTIRDWSGFLTSAQPPEFDPSGTHLAFFSKGAIQVADLVTGAVAAASYGTTGSDAFAWGSDDRLFWVDAGYDVVAVPPSGGHATTVGAGDTVTSSADGGLVAFYFVQSSSRTGVTVLTPTSGRTRTIQAPGPIEPTLAVAPGSASIVLNSTPGVLLYPVGG